MSLWRNPDFVKFWGGDTVSQFGSQVTVLALPLTAVLTLAATPFEMGVLSAASYLPFLVLTLFAGVWLDRVRRRPVMVVSALGRGVVLGSVPVLAAGGLLGFGYLAMASLVLGVLTVLFEVAYQSYLPTVVRSEDLVEGNSKLQVSASAAQVGGPALGGWLVHVFSAPGALLVDAVSFLFSAGGLLAVRTKEPKPERSGERRPVLRDIGTGLRFTFTNRWLRACVLEAGTYNMFWLVLESIFVLYAVRRLGMSAGEIGLVLGAGAVGALIGSLVAKRISTRLGTGPTISLAMVTGCAAPVLVPLATGPQPVIFVLLALSFFIGGAGTTVANIQVVSLRQTLTPSAMLGRMNASYRFVAWGTVPLGSLLGGALGELIGLRPTLFVGAAGIFAAALWIVCSPIRSLREMPAAPASDAEGVAVS
ncbi:MFS transporter [Actinocrispum wychmicini]|uniref:Putative MFS family arabinose efflux permease n=1 Tax=Actinocrispum wychmicini TaxID=1213861 RepID=A0A4R2JGW2_9PSEU|nr:MFS transporter [Actinocrispum wychmicini]TCO55609.1 putative MFS family arabinose efflux permease [Actinocrispum wychmicini]